MFYNDGLAHHDLGCGVVSSLGVGGCCAVLRDK